MAKATFIKAARKDIYVRGKRVELVHSKGKNAGQKYTKLDRTVPADDKDEILIHKGESYWTWCFMNQNPCYSRTAPRPSQLTNSEFMSTYYGIMEEVEDWEPSGPEDVEEFVDIIKGELEDLRDETQDRLDNMPEQLQESDTGQMLQERIEECENLINEFECIDTCAPDAEEGEEDGDDDWLSNVVDEIKGVCFNL